MKHPGLLPSKEDLARELLEPFTIKIVYPDGAEWFIEKGAAKFGHRFHSRYYGTVVEVVEISQDMSTIWVEECSKC